MSRLQKFNENKLCPIRGKWYKKLKPADLEFCEKFIKENAQLNKNDFEFKANRVFLDNPDKPKTWGYIWSILVEVSSYEN